MNSSSARRSCSAIRWAAPHSMTISRRNLRQGAARSAVLAGYLVALIPCVLLGVALGSTVPAPITNVLFFGPQYVVPTALSRTAPPNYWWSLPIWAVVLVVFGWATRKWRLRHVAWVAVLVLLGVTIALHLLMPTLGFMFDVVGP